MAFWIVFIGAFLLSFGFVLLVGAPYVPTLKISCDQALNLLDLKRGQTLLELGSGDGAMLVAAARRGLKAVGYELNPFLVIISKLRTRRYRSQVKVRWGSFWSKDLSSADGVYVFLIDHFMSRLDTKMKEATTKKTIRLVSHAYSIPGKKAAAQQGAMLLYIYGPIAKQR